jgi:hypothetical protein
VRMLSALNGASTSRVLNLLSIEKAHADNPEYTDKPLFRSAAINTSLILKHRLRAGEGDFFEKYKPVALKIIVPFVKSDLKVGGRSIFVDQKFYAESLLELGRYAPNEESAFERDKRTLGLIDSLPSLDPFILKEYLASHGILVADCYFNISKSDQASMKDYVIEQVQRLTKLSSEGPSLSGNLPESRLAVSLLSNAIDEKLDPLRKAFGLSEGDFRAGVFAWRGFLYYKWRLEALWPTIKIVRPQIERLCPIGRMDLELKKFILESRQSIAASIANAMKVVETVIGRYESSYNSLVDSQNPKAFCDFLLAAPPLFMQLGETMGAIEHIASYWSYRFPGNQALIADAQEVQDIFSEFTASFPKIDDRAMAALSA